ncbi:helix-turn-helix transcriptional regulator [Methanocaldococcus infernus]|uniref:helix-turn-helix transcriptional regulator n=1 Tax=Methanocaldococcus infernus TaxID=67760 RepID=UPI0012F646E3|nr:winged helix-turn-helix transcriptional regulator [Methanocaldococcus infernus]
MVKIKKIILILLFLLLPLSLGERLEHEIVNQKIYCNISYNNLAYENINILMKIKNDTETLYYYIPHKLDNLKVNSSINYSDLVIYYIGGYTKLELEFNKTLKKGELINISIKGICRDCIFWKDNYQFITSYLVAGNTTVKVVLPPGYILASDVITPSNYYITGNGKNQIIIWKFKNQEPSIVTFSFKYMYAPYSPPSSNTTKTKSNLILILASLLIASLLGVSLKFFKDKKDRDKELEKLKSLLNEKDLEIKKLTEEIKKKEEILNIVNGKVSKVEMEKEELKNQVNSLKNENEKLIKLISELSEEKEKLAEENKKLRERVIELEEEIKNYLTSRCKLIWDFLTEDERKIVEIIKEHGHITQKELIEITGMSKPKVSRIVSELQDRGIIIKEKIGRINKLTLSDEIKNNL